MNHTTTRIYASELPQPNNTHVINVPSIEAPSRFEVAQPMLSIHKKPLSKRSYSRRFTNCYSVLLMSSLVHVSTGGIRYYSVPPGHAAMYSGNSFSKGNEGAPHLGKRDGGSSPNNAEIYTASSDNDFS